MSKNGENNSPARAPQAFPRLSLHRVKTIFLNEIKHLPRRHWPSGAFGAIGKSGAAACCVLGISAKHEARFSLASDSKWGPCGLACTELLTAPRPGHPAPCEQGADMTRVRRVNRLTLGLCFAGVTARVAC